ERTAPAAFNDSDDIQVTRRIEREQGSLYRINGKESRALEGLAGFLGITAGIGEDLRNLRLFGIES
ncbi:hypothetical protein ACCS53_38620, partial [Rhizobium ruizarguesonis]